MKRNSDNILIEWLVLNAQSGDTSALNQLVERLYPKLLSYSLRQLNDDEGARDVVQNVFEVLTKDLHRVADPAAFIGWVYQVTHRKGVDHIRRKQRRRKLQNQYAQEQLSADDETQKDDGLALCDVVKNLSPQAYHLVHLYYLEGFSTKEVALILSIPQGTVKSRLFQLRKQLKSYF
jgi:RNA polymerase sigma-70 factor (ECF subfamily)